MLGFLCLEIDIQRKQEDLVSVIRLDINFNYIKGTSQYASRIKITNRFCEFGYVIEERLDSFKKLETFNNYSACI